MSFGSGHICRGEGCTHVELSTLTDILRHLIEGTRRLSTGLDQLQKGRQKFMSQVSEFEKVEEGIITQISTDLGNIVVGITALDTLIQGFQNSPGTLSPADQQSLDNIVKASQALKAQAEAISTAAPQPVVVADPTAGTTEATGTASE